MTFSYRDLTGNYEEDFPVLKEMLQSLETNTTIDNMEGPVITHQFTSTANEVIDHTLERIPTRLMPVLLETAQGSVLFVSATDKKVTLKASDADIRLSFYLE